MKVIIAVRACAGARVCLSVGVYMSLVMRCWGSVVGVTIRYELDGSGLEPRWGPEILFSPHLARG